MKLFEIYFLENNVQFWFEDGTIISEPMFDWAEGAPNDVLRNFVYNEQLNIVSWPSLKGGLREINLTDVINNSSTRMIKILVGKEIHKFASYLEWLEASKRWAKIVKVKAVNCLLVDAAGRVCSKIEDMKRAGTESMYPITVFSKIEELPNEKHKEEPRQGVGVKSNPTNPSSPTITGGQKLSATNGEAGESFAVHNELREEEQSSSDESRDDDRDTIEEPCVSDITPHSYKEEELHHIDP